MVFFTLSRIDMGMVLIFPKNKDLKRMPLLKLSEIADRSGAMVDKVNTLASLNRYMIL